MKTVVVIPARYGASRLPGKPLADIGGKPMILHVYEKACRASGIHRVVVATDDPRIQQAVMAVGGEAMLTSPHCASGTDRVAEVASRVEGDIFVNVQGDEPFLRPATIEATVALVESGRFAMASAMTPLQNTGELESRAVVKVLVDKNNRALYFSRYPIPYGREPLPASGFIPYRHLGLYVYTRHTLEMLTALPPVPMEKAESLEQLRALEQGLAIGMALVEEPSFGIDTPEDLERARALA